MRRLIAVGFLSLFLLHTESSMGQDLTAAVPHFNKVLWIVLENTSASSALQEPYLKALISRGAWLQNMRGETHPSQPNYIAMIAGDTLGVHGDGNVDLAAEHLGDLLERRGRTWKTYADGYPGGCYLSKASGKYVRKHVPFLSFLNVTSNPNRCSLIVNSSAFSADLESRHLPDFSMYIPDLDNDGHDTGVSFAAKYIEKQFGALFSNEQFLKDTLVVLTFDEGSYFGGNQIYTVLLGGGTRPGSVSTQDLNHINLLKLIEFEWNLGTLNRGDRNAEILTGIWR